MQRPLSLREKIGQLLIVGFRGSTPEDTAIALRDVREHGVGGVVLFDEEMADGSRGARNITSPTQLRALTRHLQAHAAVPLLIAIDQEGGRVNRLKPAYGFPPTLSHEELGRLDRTEETGRHARAIAATLADAGVNWNLAPVVDLDANPANPIIRGKARTFSGDPEAVARHAGAFVQAHRQAGVLTCLKHFPGHGSAAGDTHLGLVDVTSTWTDRELTPFQQLIESGLCDAVMSAHVFNARLDAAHPATLSRAVITELLRDRLGFGGVVVSDDMEMRAISAHYGLENSLPEALNAGVDLFCFGNNLSYDPGIASRAVGVLMNAVASGRVTEQRIDEACDRVLALKARVGIPGWPPPRSHPFPCVTIASRRR